MIAAEHTAAILLAAGRSQRFGAADKLLAPFAGKPLALHAASLLQSLAFGRLIAVCRPGSPLAPLLADLGFAIVPVSAADAGMARSIADGVAEAMTGPGEAALIHLADMPHLNAVHIKALLNAHAEDGITASSCNGIAMPPALFGRAHFPTLCTLSGDMGARAMLARATLIPASPAMMKDVDRPADLLD